MAISDGRRRRTVNGAPVLFLQIKQAEVALADGRLDEAYSLLAGSEALRSHRRGQTLSSELVVQFVQRGKLHLAAERTTEALADCEKAQRLGGNAPEIITLRETIERNILESNRNRRTVAKAGVLEAAAALVDSAVGRNDLDRAVAELVRARGNGVDDKRIRALDENVRTNLQTQIEECLDAGNLDQIDLLMERLDRLDPQGLAVQKLKRSIEASHSAWNAIQRGAPAEAQEILHRLSSQRPEAKWINAALAQIETLEESLKAIRRGPLGMLQTTPDMIPAKRETGATPVLFTPNQRQDFRVTEQLPMKFVIQVDGAGSYLVHRKSLVTFGPISSARVPDVGLITDASATPITIERMEDDYFLRTTNGSVSSKLLTSNERLALSPRCRLIFTLPNSASTSAVVELASGRFPRADLRKVILLDRDMIIGPGAGSHIRVDQLTEPVVLHIRNGQLWCKATPIVMDSPITVGGVSLTVTMG